MGTKDVRITTELNKHVWATGVRSPPPASASAFPVSVTKMRRPMRSFTLLRS